jgi:hypothetical protein
VLAITLADRDSRRSSVQSQSRWLLMAKIDDMKCDVAHYVKMLIDFEPPRHSFEHGNFPQECHWITSNCEINVR